MDLKGQVLAARAHGHVFCLWMQCPEWYKSLPCVEEEVPILDLTQKKNMSKEEGGRIGVSSAPLNAGTG